MQLPIVTMMIPEVVLPEVDQAHLEIPRVLDPLRVKQLNKLNQAPRET